MSAFSRDLIELTTSFFFSLCVHFCVQDDMQKGVHAKFVDMSTSVREAAVELIGRFVLNKPELILQYYDMIIERILVSSL